MTRPLAFLSLLSLTGFLNAQELPQSLHFEPGPINAIAIQRDGKTLAINRSPDSAPDLLLLTHSRRDIVESARGQRPVQTMAPSSAQAYLEATGEHWTSWWEKRFDYYGQQVTQRPTRDFPAARYLDAAQGDDSLEWEGLSIRFLETPGYTRDGMTYLCELEGKKIAFVGDLVLAGGKVRDLYSFQNEIREAKIGAYHGHLGRLATWLKSIETLAAEKPDILVPSRGPCSFTPAGDLRQATESARNIYRNYLSTNALHWYFGEERMNTCAERVLGPDHGLQGMPFAEHIDLPDWCQHIGTTKLLVSESGAGFALDVGGAKAFETVTQALSDGLITRLDGIFATHTHNDHTAAIGEAARKFSCPVFAIAEVADVIAHPDRWFLPGVTPHRVDTVTTVPDGHVMKWKEFTFTFRFFPGQMYNHGALLVEKPGHDPVFFIGDSFSPSGMDDYCLMNRNLMRDDTGYALCFRIIGELPKSTWLVNQHIPHLFRFNEEETEFLTSSYRTRGEMISRFVAWDDLNYAIDEQWASCYPYGQEIPAGRDATVEVRLWNHSTVERKFTVSLHHPNLGETDAQSVTIPARERGSLLFKITTGKLNPGTQVITADIERDDGRENAAFCEALLRITPP